MQKILEFQVNTIVVLSKTSQASGKGHLQRTKTIVSCLRKDHRFQVIPVCISDTFMKETYGLDSDYLSEFIHENNCIVVDSPFLTNQDIEYILNFQTRILISPVNNELNIFTHILVRSLACFDLGILGNAPEIVVAPDFGFSSCIELKKRSLDFNHLRLGICLSGGLLDNEYQIITQLLRFFHFAQSITIYSHRPELSSRFSSAKHIKIAKPVNDLWDQYDFNIFITGQGLMPWEAIFQGIPTYTIELDAKKSKLNQFLISNNVLRSIRIEDIGITDGKNICSSAEEYSRWSQDCVRLSSEMNIELLSSAILQIASYSLL